MAAARSRRGPIGGMPAGHAAGPAPARRATPGWPGVLAAVLLGFGVLGPAGPARAQPRGEDRVLDLVAEARRSSCFTAPSRPPAAQPPAAELRLAAEGGDAAAMQRLAEAWLAEPTRSRQALGWLERAALGGAPGAAAEAGSLHAAGRGTPQDPALATRWWLYGATRGDTRAMACLSAAYLLGRGVPQDLAEAARWAMLREARAPGRSMLRPAAADFERALPSATLAEARRLARETPPPSPAPGGSLPPAGEAPGAWPDTLREARLPDRPEGAVESASAGAVVVGAAGLLVTTASAVADCAAIEVHAGLAQLGGAVLHGANRELDLALLSVPGLARPPLPLRIDPRPEEEVLVLGFRAAPAGRARPAGAPPETLPARLAAAAGGPETLPIAPLPGATGLLPGAAVLDRRGALVGLVPGRVGAQARALPGALIARFLEDVGLPRAAAPGAPAAEPARSVVEVVCHRPRGANLSRVAR